MHNTVAVLQCGTVSVCCNVECSQTTVEASLGDVIWDLKQRLLSKTPSVSLTYKLENRKVAGIYPNNSCVTLRNAQL